MITRRRKRCLVAAIVPVAGIAFQTQVPTTKNRHEESSISKRHHPLTTMDTTRRSFNDDDENDSCWPFREAIFTSIPHNKSNREDAVEESTTQSRRQFFQNSIAGSSLALGGGICAAPTLANVDDNRKNNWDSEKSTKILVLGGTGLVGSKIVTKLKSMGVNAIATSRDGRNSTIQFDVAKPGINIEQEIKNLAQDCTGIISTIGVIGTEDDEVVNRATGLAAIGAAKFVNQFVYISIAPEVKEFAKGIHFLKPYVNGKFFSEDAITSNFPTESTLLIEPTFIYGGDNAKFNVNPPRISSFYGEFIETLLLSSASNLRSLTNITPDDDGIVKNKIALEAPVSVDSVADAAIAGALGWTDGILDTHDSITELGITV